jgi:diaminopimelate decarboxylase
MIRHEIAGVDIVEFVRRFGTPTYVYDAAIISARINELAAFDVVRYAQKANSNLAILDLFRRAGVLVDAVSAGEITRALAAGYLPQGDPPPIVYTADVFDHDALSLIVDKGIAVNCGSPQMIDQLGAIAPGRNIMLRINPGFGHGHSRKTNTGGEQSKHGIWHEQLADCLLRADHLGLCVTGLHMHIGSGCDLEHLQQVCGAMERCAAEVGRSLTTISAGGGLPVCYKESDERIDLARYFGLWDETRRRLEARLRHPVRLEVEPGRYLVAESGYLITEIRIVKQMGPNTFYLVDAGFNSLARPILYGAFHPISIAPRSKCGIQSHVEVIVGGPLCESGDIFTQEEGGFVCCRELPLAAVGDFLVIELAGAYGAAMASNYNSKPLAAEVLIENGDVHLIRERQTLADLMHGERIPPRGKRDGITADGVSAR